MEHKCFIGIYNDYENTNIVTCSELRVISLSEWESYLKYKDVYKSMGRNSPTPIEDYFDKRKNTELTRFDYCPICGKKINWNELKRRCKE